MPTGIEVETQGSKADEKLSQDFSFHLTPHSEALPVAEPLRVDNTPLTLSDSIHTAYENLLGEIEKNRQGDNLEGLTDKLKKFIQKVQVASVSHDVKIAADSLNQLIKNDHFINNILTKNMDINQDTLNDLFKTFDTEGVKFTPETAKKWINIHNERGLSIHSLRSELIIKSLKDMPGGELIAEHYKLLADKKIQKIPLDDSILMLNNINKYAKALHEAFTASEGQSLPRGFDKGVYIALQAIDRHEGKVSDALALVGIKEDGNVNILLDPTQDTNPDVEKWVSYDLRQKMSVSTLITHIVYHQLLEGTPGDYLPSHLVQKR